MIRTICNSNKGYKDELNVGAYYYFDNFKGTNTFTGDIFGNMYILVDGEYIYKGVYPRKLFTIA